MTTTWHRALDDQGRMYAFGVTGDRVAIYYPDLEGQEFTFGNRRGGFGFNHPVRLMRLDRELVHLEDFKRTHYIVGQVEAKMTPGTYFPRVYRGPEHAPIDVPARTATMRVARGLYSRLRSMFQVIEPTRAHDQVFGHELRQLLILACTEVESSWRAILSANDYPQGGGHWTTKDFVKLLGPMRLDSYAVTLASHPAYGEIVPFRGWSATNPTGSLPWYDAYNHTKHNREEGLHCGSLLAVVLAMAAVHVMTVAQFGFDEVERGHFNVDEFNFERSPKWLDDAYIRPLLPPEKPFMVDGRHADWPVQWVKGQFPF